MQAKKRSLRLIRLFLAYIEGLNICFEDSVEFTKEDLDSCNIRFVVPGRRSAIDCKCHSIKEFKGTRTPKPILKKELEC